MGIYVTGIAPLHSGVGSGVVDDREWLEEGEEGLGKEVRLSEEQLKIIDEIVGGAASGERETARQVLL